MKKIIIASALGAMVLLAGCGVKSDVSSTATTATKTPGTNYCKSGRQLSQVQLEDLQHVMEVNLPLNSKDLGSPLLMIDWNKYGLTCWRADEGWKMVIGFANLAGPGWGRGFFEYSTYNFSDSDGHETFGNSHDYKDVIQGKKAHPIEVDGVKGFVQYYWSSCQPNPLTNQPADRSGEPECLNGNVLEKRIIFPFFDHYDAVVYRFVGNYPALDDKLINDLYAGKYPAEEKAGLELTDKLVQSLNFPVKQ